MSSRVLRQRSEKFHKNIEKRGLVQSEKKKDSMPPVGPIVLGFFLFVVVGSGACRLSFAVSLSSSPSIHPLSGVLIPSVFILSHRCSFVANDPGDGVIATHPLFLPSSPPTQKNEKKTLVYIEETTTTLHLRFYL
ncbi:Ribosome associated membrane protein RAMP4 [Balamuthia mandrillaris]